MLARRSERLKAPLSGHVLDSGFMLQGLQLQGRCAYIEPHQEHVYILIRTASAIHTLGQSQDKKWPILPARQKVLVALI